MITTNTTTDEHAVAEFVDVFNDQCIAGDIAARFTCGEIEALTGMLRAAGADQAADLWTEAHALEDDEGDAHYQPAPAELLAG